MILKSVNKMKTLQTIFNKLKPGDIVLKQTVLSENQIEKPKLVIIVGIDVWDMACAVYYTDWKYFEYSLLSNKSTPKVEAFGEWMECWYILGHWKTMPKFINLSKAYRRKK